MCGRFTLYSNFEEAKSQFDLHEGYNYLPSFNIAPTQITPIISLSSDQKRILVPMKWGLIPHWDQSEVPRRHFNARAETVASKPTFKQSFIRRRCLAITNGFYEWKSEKIKQPYFISMNSKNLFAIAAIWERRVIEKVNYDMFSLITTEPNEIMTPIHDRMPVIIKPENYDRWLLNDNTNIELLENMLKPYDADKMQAYPVTPKMNKPVFNNEACIKSLYS